MKTNLFNVRRHARIGPGGWRCICCGPAPKYRKLWARLHKRRINRLLKVLDKE